jgi:hypothetical protein
MARPLLLLIALSAVPLPAGARQAPEALQRPAIAESDITPQLGTDWYGLYMHGKKVGYARAVLERAPGPDGAYRSTLLLNARLTGIGVKITMTVDQALEFDAAPPYALRRGHLTQAMDKSRQHIELQRGAKGFNVAITEGGEKRTKQIADLDYTLADELAPVVWLLRGAKAGDRLNTRRFEIEELKVDQVKRKLLSTKTSLVQGVKVVYHEVESHHPKDGLTTVERYDHKGRLLSDRISDVMELRLEAEADAKNIDYSADLFVLGNVKIDKALGADATRVKRLVLEVVGKEASLLEAGPRQEVARTEAGAFVCKLGKDHARKVPASAKEIEECLAETVAYPIHHPKVQKLLEKAVGNAETPRAKVKRLVRFVHGYLKPDYASKPVSVLDLIEVKRGSCVQCAQLLTTLGRAAGIPTRQVGGLMYLGDDQKAFGGHEWNEVVLDGHWVPVDAAWNQMEIDATHISFGPEGRGGFRQLAATGKLSFRLLEVERAK